MPTGLAGVIEYMADKIAVVRAAIPYDSGETELFTSDNPGVVSDPIVQSQIESVGIVTNDTLVVATDTLAETETIEHHIHNVERWFGIAAAQTSRNWMAEGVDNPFVAASAANAWGPIIQVIGRGDTPVTPMATTFDMHRILVSDATVNTQYKIRFIFTNGGVQHAIEVDQYTEQMFMIDAANPQQSGGFPVDVLMPRVPNGTMVYAQVWNATGGAEASFFIAFHPYPPVRCNV